MVIDYGHMIGACAEQGLTNLGRGVAEARSEEPLAQCLRVSLPPLATFVAVFG